MTSPSPPGWYPDPHQDSTGVRWYDGSEWTDHTRDQATTAAAPGLPPPRPLARGFFGLARVLQGVLHLNALLAIAAICYDVWAINVFDRWLDEYPAYSISTARLVDDLATAEARATLGLTLLTGVLFIVWLYQANQSDRVDQTALRRGPGWSIGGWFVPIGNLFLPFQQVSDVHRGASIAHEAGPRTGSAVIGWWWATWLCSNLGAWVIAALFSSRSPGHGNDAVQAIRGLRSGDLIDLASSLITILAAVLAVAVVRRITDLLRRP